MKLISKLNILLLEQVLVVSNENKIVKNPHVNCDHVMHRMEVSDTDPFFLSIIVNQ